MSAKSRAKLQALIDCYKRINTDMDCCIERKGCENYVPPHEEEKPAGGVKQTTDDARALFNRRSADFNRGINLDNLGQDSPDDTDEETDTDWDDDDMIKGIDTDKEEDSDAEVDDGRENTRNKDTETDDDDDEEYKEVQRAREQKKKEQTLRVKAAEEADADREAEKEGGQDVRVMMGKRDAEDVEDVISDAEIEEQIIRSLLSSHASASSPPAAGARSTMLTSIITAADAESASALAFTSATVTVSGSAARTAFDANASATATATQTLSSKHFKEDFDGAKEFFKGTGIGLGVGAVLIFLTAGLLVGGFALYKRRFGSGSGKP